MSPRALYLTGTFTWFSAFGIQGVLFAWLVTMVLDQSAAMVGFAQMALLLPGTLLMLFGGAVSDVLGPKRVVVSAQFFALVPLLFLIYVLSSDTLSYQAMLIYGVLMGIAQAFVTPSRDGMLNMVAGSRLQRTVVFATMMQFGGQIVGFILAGFADRFGAVPIVIAQCVLLSAGAFAYSRVPISYQPPARQKSFVRSMGHSIADGARTVIGNSSMVAVMVQNVAMAMFFMSSYLVCLPILIREVFDGSAQDLAWINMANSAGLVLTAALLLPYGDVKRPGRTLLLNHGIGSLTLAAGALSGSFVWLAVFIFAWGINGGFAIAMSRSIMQQLAPTHQVSRVMSFYNLSFMGAGPIGMLLGGFLAARYGPASAIIISCALMIAVNLSTIVWSPLWRLNLDDAAPARQAD